MKVWDENENFQELLKKDTDIEAHLSAAEIEAAFKLRDLSAKCRCDL